MLYHAIELLQPIHDRLARLRAPRFSMVYRIRPLAPSLKVGIFLCAKQRALRDQTLYD